MVHVVITCRREISDARWEGLSAEYALQSAALLKRPGESW
jgi:hypothetical protein